MAREVQLETLKCFVARSAKDRLARLTTQHDPLTYSPAICRAGCDRTRTSIHRHNTCPTRVSVGALGSATARDHYLMCFPDEREKTPNAKNPALFKRGFLKHRAGNYRFF